MRFFAQNGRPPGVRRHFAATGRLIAARWMVNMRHRAAK
jgi:hypothetical protein